MDFSDYDVAHAQVLKGPPYRGTNGKYLTQALFYEYWATKPSKVNYLPVFCTRHTPQTRKIGLVPVYDTFLALDDPTGYEWAKKYLDSWDVYNRLMQYDWFRECIESALDEMANRKKARAIARIEEIMRDGSDSQALAAAKYIAERGWDPKPAKRGRPSKAEVTGALKQQVELSQLETEDLKRIGLSALDADPEQGVN